MADNSKLTGTKSRGTGSTSVGSSRIASIPAAPTGYENIFNTGQVIGLEVAHVLMPSSAKEFMARARNKHEFLINHSDRLLAVSPLNLLEAQSRIAGTLLNMEIELERRLNEPYGLTQFMGVAWPNTDPLAGLVEYAYPFSHADSWQEYVDRFQKALSLEKRRARRFKPKKQVPEPEAKVKGIDSKEIEKRVRGIDKKGLDSTSDAFVEESKKRSSEQESDLPSKVGIGIEAAAALVGELAAAEVALVAGLAAPILSVGFYFISLGQGVKEQHRNAFVSGFRRGAIQWVNQLQLRKNKTVAKVQFNAKIHLNREKIICVGLNGVGRDPYKCWLTKNVSSSWPAVGNKIIDIRIKYYLRTFEKMNLEVTSFERDYRDKLWDPLWEALQKTSYEGNDFEEILDKVYLKYIGGARLEHMKKVKNEILAIVKP